jgi:hypothetical protein
MDVVKEAGPRGLPAGPMYAALMGLMSLEVFQHIMDALVKNGNVKHEYHCYYWLKDLN